MAPIFRSSSQCWSPSTWPTYSSSSTVPRTCTSVRVGGGGQGAALRFPTQWHPAPRGASPFPMDTNLRFRWKESAKLKSPKSCFMEARGCPLKGPYAPACVGSLCQPPPLLPLWAVAQNSTSRQSGNERVLPRAIRLHYGGGFSVVFTFPFPPPPLQKKKKCCYLRNLLTSCLQRNTM